jgi:putative salt-induced outer membrane protein YdiY
MLKRTRPTDTRTQSFLRLGLVALVCSISNLKLGAEQSILHLTTGDRVTGEIVQANELQVVVKTAWGATVTVPRDFLVRMETVPAVSPVTNAPATLAAVTTNSPAQSPAKKPKETSEWTFEAKLGADMIRGERERDIYYGQMSLTYAHPFESNPKKFFRNKLDYRADYGTTDGETSANRMALSDKTDFDISECAYIYNFVGGGYDKVRLINAQYEIGPGVGYHLFRKPNFAANVESGLTYQYQDRDAEGETESLFGRVGQDITWKLYPRIVLTQKSTVLMSLEDAEELQFRLEANLSFGLLQYLSLNVTAIELFDTQPVTGISQNEFQLRSSLGVTF